MDATPPTVVKQDSRQDAVSWWCSHYLPSCRAPLSEDDDLIDRLLEHNPTFCETLRARLDEKTISAKDARRRL
jgi:hypothetical protein